MTNKTKRRSTLVHAATGLVAGLGVLVVATAAFAHDDFDHRRKWKGPPFVPPGHMHHYSRAPIIYVPPPVVVYPPAIIYDREPVYYYQAPPPSLNINLNFPLH